MNLWVPISPEAVAEAKGIMHVTKNIMNPAKNKINMGLVYDLITSSHLLVREKLLPEVLATELLELTVKSNDYASLPARLRKHKIAPHSGRGVFSALLPEDLDYEKGDVLIRDGVIIAGSLTADHVAPKSRTILEKIYMEYGEERYSDFVTCSCFMLFKFIEERGHTVGIADCLAIDNEKRAREERENDIAFENIQAQIDALPAIIEDDEILINLREQQIKNIIQASGEVGFNLLMEDVKRPTNNLGIMLEGIGGGAKGKRMNLQQMRGRLGQQFRKGERLPVNCGGRILSGFDVDDPDIRARGYVKSNFTRGLTPEEFFLHMMASREQLIDIAVNVPIVGDIHRKLVKALENLIIDHTGAVTNTSKACFMLLYGGDGFAGDRLTLVKPPYTVSGSIPMFFDPFDLANDINIKYGWTAEKEERVATYRRYVLDMEVTITVDGKEIKLCDVDPFTRKMFTDVIFEYLKDTDDMLQQVEVPIERAKVEAEGEGGKEVTKDECVELLRLYYDVSKVEGGLAEIKERYDEEVAFQIEMLLSMDVIVLRNEKVLVKGLTPGIVIKVEGETIAESFSTTQTVEVKIERVYVSAI